MNFNMQTNGSKGEFPATLKDRWPWMSAGGGTEGKAPTDRNGAVASKHDVDAHRTFNEIVEEDPEGGMGTVIPTGYAVLDFDKCFDPDPDNPDVPGSIKERFKDLVENTDTYMERSSSGWGLHAYLKSNTHPDGESEKHKFDDGSAIEVLGPGCFVKATGCRYGDKPLELASGTTTVDNVLTYIRANKPKIKERTSTTTPRYSDDEIFRLIRGAANAAKFANLYDDGNVAMEPYNGDDSAADLGLISMLAFYTQNDEQLDRLYRDSALMRKKWDERRGSSTYGARTIAKALDGLTETYTPSQRVLNRAVEPSPNGSGHSPNSSELLLGFSERLPIHTYMRDGIEPPKLLIDDVLYAGTKYEDGSTEGVVHTWYGEPGCGKSMLALWASVEVMRMGFNVVYIDEEGTRRMVTERLQGLGAKAEEIEAHFFYFNSTALAASEKRHQAQLDIIAQKVRPELVIFDSWIDFLATDGRSENSSDEVVGWAQLVSRSFIAVGSTVVLLDHIPKDGSGRGARGSGGKLGWVTAGHRVEVKSPFNRDLTGEVKLIRQKDREGALPHVIFFTVGGDGTGRIICRPDASVITSHEDDGLTPNMRDALEALPADGATYSAWFANVGISSKDSFTKAINGLLSRGRVAHVGKIYTPVETVLKDTESASEWEGIEF